MRWLQFPEQEDEMDGAVAGALKMSMRADACTIYSGEATPSKEKPGRLASVSRPYPSPRPGTKDT